MVVGVFCFVWYRCKIDSKDMTHSEFVEAYKAGQVAVRVNRNLAVKVMNSPSIHMPKRFKVAHDFWTWIFLLSIPVAIAVGILVTWWVGLIIFIICLPLSRAIQNSATKFVLEHALENSEFFEKAVDMGLLIIEEKNHNTSSPIAH
jgi:hypothetical protein